MIVPGTTYLQLVWETHAIMTMGAISSTVCVELEEIRFLRATTISPGQNVDFTVMIHYGSGKFEITENGVSVVTGVVREMQTEKFENDSIEMEESLNNLPILEKKDFYKELRLRGYHYQDLFQGINFELT